MPPIETTMVMPMTSQAEWRSNSPCFFHMM
jgi:hypothetical protein